MQTFSKLLAAAAFAVLAAGPVAAQQQPTPAAIGYAKEILTLKNAPAMYQSAVPGMIERTKAQLVQSNLNYQKDLNEVAVLLAQQMNGREKEIGDQMARLYATDFTEQELKELVTFYKTPLGQKLINQEPRVIQASLGAMNEWAQKFAEDVDKAFRAEMRKRGKEI
jgi:hypothetical protein